MPVFINCPKCGSDQTCYGYDNYGDRAQERQYFGCISCKHKVYIPILSSETLRLLWNAQKFEDDRPRCNTFSDRNRKEP